MPDCRLDAEQFNAQLQQRHNTQRPLGRRDIHLNATVLAIFLSAAGRPSRTYNHRPLGSDLPRPGASTDMT